MKVPKMTKKFCAKCKNYTEHRVSQAKRRGANATHPMSLGSKKRAKLRGVRGSGSKGKYSKPPASKFKMGGKKHSKKIDLRFACGQCKRIHITTSGVRARKVEIV